MTEVLFYHLQDMTLENVLPPLLEKSLERGWRVVVQSTSEERADALDAHLWTYRDDSFLPHATWRVADVAEQPIVLVIEADNPNGANVRFLVDNAPLPSEGVAPPPPKQVFKGWMFANSPGLNPLQSPIYDAWLIACMASPPPA